MYGVKLLWPQEEEQKAEWERATVTHLFPQQEVHRFSTRNDEDRQIAVSLQEEASLESTDAKLLIGEEEAEKWILHYPT